MCIRLVAFDKICNSVYLVTDNGALVIDKEKKISLEKIKPMPWDVEDWKSVTLRRMTCSKVIKLSDNCGFCFTGEHVTKKIEEIMKHHNITENSTPQDFSKIHYISFFLAKRMNDSFKIWEIKHTGLESDSIITEPLIEYDCDFCYRFVTLPSIGRDAEILLHNIFRTFLITRNDATLKTELDSIMKTLHTKYFMVGEKSCILKING